MRRLLCPLKASLPHTDVGITGIVDFELLPHFIDGKLVAYGTVPEVPVQVAASMRNNWLTGSKLWP